MTHKFYAIHDVFSQLSFDDETVREMLAQNQTQIEKIFFTFDEADIMKRAQNFLGSIEKEGDCLVYRHELFHKENKIKVEKNHIIVYEGEENAFMALLNRVYRNYVLI